MSSLSISNVIRVTLQHELRALSNVNTSALAIITDEVPIPSDYGEFRTYLDPVTVASDWGSNSETYRLALKVFGQSPNILTGTGYLVIIPRVQSAAAQPATILSAENVDLTLLIASDYNLNAAVDGGLAADLLIGSVDSTDLVTAAASLNSIAVAGANLIFTLSGEVTSAKVTLKTTTTGATSAIVIGAAGTGTDIASGLSIAGATATGADAGIERVKDAILRTAPGIPYFGIVLNEKQTDANLLEVASLVQTLDKMLFVGSNLSADIAGVFKTITDSGYTHTRCLYYSVSETDALDFAAGYASRGLSVNFSAANTAITMNLKEIIGLVADPGLSQTIYDSAKNNGVDIYANFNIPKTQSFGANQFFDQVYNRLAFKLRLQVAGFNFLATTQTKIPQTEIGMNGLKAAYRAVCALFVTNGVFAPGAWNNATTFGSPEDHKRNIEEQGYFIYSIAIAQQAQTERNNRIFPLVQIAAKEAGAGHSSDVLVSVES